MVHRNRLDFDGDTTLQSEANLRTKTGHILRSPYVPDQGVANWKITGCS